MVSRRLLFASLYEIVGFLVFSIVAIVAAFECTEVAIVLSILGVCIVGEGIVKRQKQLFSLTLVFWLFSALYALAVPVSIVLGEDTDPTFIAGNLAKNVNPFLVAYALSCIGFIMGQLQIGQSNRKCNGKSVKRNKQSLDVNFLIRGAILSAFLASLFEVINLFRVGGVEMLFVGKAIYQANVGDLFLTLPSATMYTICGLFCGMLIAHQKIIMQKSKVKTCLFFCILCLCPFVICKMLLGMRGALASAILTGIASYTVLVPIKRISCKILFYIALIYIFMVFLYTNRSIVSLLLSNPGNFISTAFDIERLSSNFNPGNSEFGAAFGNFCVFFEKYGTEFSEYFGLTYLQGFAVPIPSFLYPGEKPLQITYAFRDEFFAAWASRSRIASTGFSSILEGYVNGGFLGVFLAYFIWGILLKIADKIRLKKTSVIGIMLSSMLVSTCMDFSRTAFGGCLGEYIWGALYCLFIYTVAKYVRISMTIRN